VRPLKDTAEVLRSELTPQVPRALAAALHGKRKWARMTSSESAAVAEQLVGRLRAAGGGIPARR
jgi:hypothetical protein